MIGYLIHSLFHKSHEIELISHRWQPLEYKEFDLECSRMIFKDVRPDRIHTNYRCFSD